MVHKNTLDFFFNLITLLNLLTNNLVTDSFFFFFFNMDSNITCEGPSFPIRKWDGKTDWVEALMPSNRHRESSINLKRNTFQMGQTSHSCFFLIGVWLIYSVVLVSGVQQSDSVIHTFFLRFFSIASYYWTLNIAACAVHRSWLFICFICSGVYILTPNS